MPRRKGKQEHGQHLRETDQTQRQSRLRALVEFPADSDGEHLLAERGNEPAEEVQAEITVAEDCIGAVAALRVSA